jgi:hypothetical protein
VQGKLHTVTQTSQHASWNDTDYCGFDPEFDRCGAHAAAGAALSWHLTSERDKTCIAWVVSRFLDAAPYVSALGDVLCAAV